MTTSAKRNKKYEIIYSIIAAILTIPYGVAFSLITHFQAESSHLLFKLLVWLLGIAFCISFVYGLLKLFKFKHKLNLKLVFILTSVISATLAVAIAGTFELDYFITLAAIVGLYELFHKILEKKNDNSRT